MCAVSMMMQKHLDEYDRTGWYKFNQIVDDYIKAKNEDIDNGEPDCEHDDKLDRIQQIIGLDLRQIR
jgi:hypothetical protein